MFNANVIADQLKKLKYPEDEIAIYCNYCSTLLNKKRKDGNGAENPWMSYKTNDQLINYFCIVKREGLFLDGKHITLQNIGISYDYIAYKNKMFVVYPESIFDVQLTYKDDTFSFKKVSGKVQYTHEINNPFGRTEKDIIGGYCVIKNKRGEFITTLSADDFNKHRKVAKTDSIWHKWLTEMCLKTLVKKSCKVHFQDIFQNIETIDNENYDLEQPLTISIETKQEIEKINTVDELQKYFHTNKEKNAGIAKDFNKAISQKKAELLKDKPNNIKQKTN